MFFSMRLFLLLTLTSFMLYSCMSSSYVSIDVLSPAQQPVLQKSVDVALINDVFNPEKNACGQNFIFENRKLFDTTCRTRMLAESFMEGMQIIIDDSQFFTESANIAMLKKNTAPSDMIALIGESNASILLVLNDLKTNDETYFVTSTYGGYAVTRMKFTASLHFYDRASAALIETKSVTDTVYWASNEISHYEFTTLLNDRDQILDILAFEAGKKMSSHFFPTWQTVDRVIMIPPGATAQRGAEAALSGSWERADYYWEALSREKNKQKSSAGWFNMALYQEINGDFETASDYLRRADAIYSRKINRDYLEILNERMALQKKFEALTQPETE